MRKLWWLVIAVATGGCMLFQHGSSGETRVGDGKLYQSDNPTYDEFFQGVYDLQTHTKDALEEEGEARAPLERALGTRNTSPDHLGQLLRDRFKSKNNEGAPVRIMVIGLDPPKEPDKASRKVEVTVSVPDEAGISNSQRDLLQSLEESAKSEANVASKYGAASGKARGLLARVGKLSASLEHDFTTPARREEVALELKASKPILSSAAERAEKASNTARSFIKAMADALPLSGEPVLSPAPTEDKAAADKTPARAQRKNGAVPPPKAAGAGQPPKPKPPPQPQPAAKPPTEAPAPKPEPQPKPAAKAPTEDFNP